jgi:hypothetical protein
MADDDKFCGQCAYRDPCQTGAHRCGWLHVDLKDAPDRPFELLRDEKCLENGERPSPPVLSLTPEQFNYAMKAMASAARMRNPGSSCPSGCCPTCGPKKRTGP